MKTAEVFANRARQRLKELGWTQETLAKKLQQSRGSVAGYLQGVTTPGADMLLRWAKALDVPIQWLLGIDDEMPLKATNSPSGAQIEALLGMAEAIHIPEEQVNGIRIFLSLSEELLSVALETLDDLEAQMPADQRKSTAG